MPFSFLSSFLWFRQRSCLFLKTTPYSLNNSVYRQKHAGLILIDFNTQHSTLPSTLLYHECEVASSLRTRDTQVKPKACEKIKIVYSESTYDRNPTRCKSETLSYHFNFNSVLLVDACLSIS